MLKAVTRCLWSNPVAGRRMLSHHISPNLSGKVAIVTASTDGIGLAAAEALGQRGAHVVVSSRRQTNVDKAVSLLRSKNIQVIGTTCNVGMAEDREKLINMTVEQCGGVDILVSNAAVNPFFGNILESTEEVWDKGLGPYSVSKTALLGLTRALAPDLAQSNIRVNCVAPGIIKTRFSSALWENEGVLEEFLKQTSIKRLGQPEDIGGVIAFLCSDEASYITGETITVTGGMNCRL
ncbi:Dehydrogenase/reductase SDR family member 4 [Anabarilius grahami]|uniref:Dehydrogenase/reductase SDR family member 4 n=1 Tax=Anabarilius grahami TaxID=495550 RepID=A0A3N0XJW3_ANAGA|nr:Dehydrogenase/reductase SDR family member 4 [Anabarilius grahami]